MPECDTSSGLCQARVGACSLRVVRERTCGLPDTGEEPVSYIADHRLLVITVASPKDEVEGGGGPTMARWSWDCTRI